jgi:hypothetical protein
VVSTTVTVVAVVVVEKQLQVKEVHQLQQKELTEFNKVQLMIASVRNRKQLDASMLHITANACNTNVFYMESFMPLCKKSVTAVTCMIVLHYDITLFFNKMKVL